MAPNRNITSFFRCPSTSSRCVSLPEPSGSSSTESDGSHSSLLALFLLVISPTSVLCERGFSVMNYVKNEFRSLLTQQNLNACMAIAMIDYTIESFPFTKLLQ